MNLIDDLYELKEILYYEFTLFKGSYDSGRVDN